MSDRIAVMSAGQVLQIAEPRTLYERPNCREVADFIGTMNFFDATVRDAESLDAGPLGILPGHAQQPDGTPVLLAVRPEKIVVSKDGGPVKGTIAASAYLGERNHIHVVVDGVREPVAVAQQNQSRDGVHYASGETVTLSWAPEAAVILPRD